MSVGPIVHQSPKCDDVCWSCPVSVDTVAYHNLTETRGLIMRRIECAAVLLDRIVMRLRPLRDASDGFDECAPNRRQPPSLAGVVGSTAPTRWGSHTCATKAQMMFTAPPIATLVELVGAAAYA